eukprot:6753224-Karenia_brevis.AAC.1
MRPAPFQTPHCLPGPTLGLPSLPSERPHADRHPSVRKALLQTRCGTSPPSTALQGPSPSGYATGYPTGPFPLLEPLF